MESLCLYGFRSNVIYSNSNVVMWRCMCFNYETSVIYLPVRFLVVLFHHSTGKIAFFLNISKVKLWEGFPFSKVKSNYKVLRFGSKTSKLRTYGKDKNNNKVKKSVKIHVGDEFEM